MRCSILRWHLIWVYTICQYMENCLKGHSKIDKTKVLKTNDSLMKVESIAEFRNTFDLH